MRNANAYRDAATWLHLAATPAFAAMALWTATAANPMDILCAQGLSSWNGMTLMYVLMAAFHAGPWLRMPEARRKQTFRTKGNAARVHG